jgi:glycosyltransferase involved in cell wall biosynthesis
VVPTISDKAACSLLQQTLRPKGVFADDWAPGTKQLLENAGIASEPAGSNPARQPESEQLLLVAKSEENLSAMEPEDLEDLVWTRRYSPYSVTAFSRLAEPANSWPGVAAIDANADNGLMLIKACRRDAPHGIAISAAEWARQLVSWGKNQTVLALRKPPKASVPQQKSTTRKTLLIAGHDLKFIKPFYPYFQKSGYRILLDFWSGHNKHDEVTSKRLVQQADVIFCEWMLGNAIWYARHKQPWQCLVGRLHAQEIRSPLFDNVPFGVFDKVVFVGPHILRHAKARNKELERNGTIIFNGVDVETLSSVPRKKINGKVLGMVGIVPRSKRMDLALDILCQLRQQDDGFTLRIKGKRPEEYLWMDNRPEEIAWYQAQYRRIVEDPLLRGAVFFDPHSDNMPEWYAGIDFPISISDHESFHFTVADGAAAGGIPIVFPWEGANEIYPANWVVSGVKEAVPRILSLVTDPNQMGKEIKEAQEFCAENFDIRKISNQILKILKRF